MAHKRSIRLQCMMSFPTVSLLLFQPSCLVPTDYLAAMLRVRRPSIQNIRKRYSDRVPPGPNTWTLNILPLGQFPRTVSPIHVDQQCDPFATYRPVSCLSASMICRCIAITQPPPPRCCCVPWAMAPTNIGAAGGALEAAAVHIDRTAWLGWENSEMSTQIIPLKDRTDLRECSRILALETIRVSAAALGRRSSGLVERRHTRQRIAETKPSDRMIAEPSACPAMPFSARHF
jgi:hypothetical protein